MAKEEDFENVTENHTKNSKKNTFYDMVQGNFHSKESYMKLSKTDEHHLKNFCADCSNSQSLDLMMYLIEGESKVIFLSGDHGLGKTTLLQVFKELKSTFYKIFLKKAELKTTISTLLKEIILELNLEENHEKNQLKILLIDDAEIYSQEQLQALLKFILLDSKNHNIKIILSGTKSLKTKLQNIKINQSTKIDINIIEIKPFTKNDVKQYLLFKYNVSLKNKNLLTNKSINNIYKKSKGYPIKINTLVNQLLETNSNSPLKNNFLNKVKNILFAKITFILLVIFCFSFYVYKFKDSIFQKNPKILEEKLNDISNYKKMDKKTSQNDNNILTANTNSTTIEQEELSKLSLEKDDLKIKLNQKTKENELLKEQLTKLKFAKENAENLLRKEIAKRKKKQILLQNKTFENTDNLNLSKIHQNKTNEQQTFSKDKNFDDKDILIQNNNTAITKNNMAQNQNKEKYSKYEEALLQFPEDTFCLQILGTSSKEQIENFIKENNLLSNAYYYKSRINDNDWFVLLYGNYDSFSEANKNIAILNETIQILKPFPRKLKSVQDSIKSRLTN